LFRRTHLENILAFKKYICEIITNQFNTSFEEMKVTVLHKTQKTTNYIRIKPVFHYVFPKTIDVFEYLYTTKPKFISYVQKTYIEKYLTFALDFFKYHSLFNCLDLKNNHRKKKPKQNK